MSDLISLDPENLPNESQQHIRSNCALIIKKMDDTFNGDEDKIKDFCEEHHCNCSHSIIKSALKHTVSITLFLLAITFILNLGFHYLGYDKISKLFFGRILGTIACASAATASAAGLCGIYNLI